MSQDETLEEIEKKNQEWLAEMRRKYGCQHINDVNGATDQERFPYLTYTDTSMMNSVPTVTDMGISS